MGVLHALSAKKASMLTRPRRVSRNWADGQVPGDFVVNRVLVILAAIAVLWHATVGCCNHHRHGQSQSARPAVAYPKFVDHVSKCDGRHAPSPVAPDSSNCENEICAFAVSTARLSVELGVTTKGLFCHGRVLDIKAPLPPHAMVNAAATTAPRLLSVLSLHLALGVLLV